MARHELTKAERGHRQPLSKTEKTIKHTLYLTESQYKKVKKNGQKWIRKLIEENNGSI